MTGSLERYPARVSLYWYSAILAIGTTLLFLPVSFRPGREPISFIDALFTATSALCVTGLSVRSTAHDFSWFGQFIILALIQLGGVGIMTVTTFVLFQLGGRSGLRHRAVIAETLGAGPNQDLKWILGRVLILSLTIELLGAILLFIRFALTDHLGSALWNSVFLSVSAFCNAGFALHDANLVPVRDDWVVNCVIMGLIISGGFGFPVMIDLTRTIPRGWPNAWYDLHLHSKLMIMASVTAIVLGALFTLALEWDGVFASLPAEQKILPALFHSVSCRTAGFNTVDIGAMRDATVFLSIILMVIGAGPCSTGGGVKISTVALLIMQAYSRFRGRSHINLFRRTIPEESIDRALASVMFYLLVATFAFIIILVVEENHALAEGTRWQFRDIMFEVASALGTVGLSTGITAAFSTMGKSILIALMFMGRLGPITVFAALALSRSKHTKEFAREEPLLG
jgi:trk system potassium uptake protein TrkH